MVQRTWGGRHRHSVGVPRSPWVETLIMDLTRTLKVESVSRLHLSPPLRVGPRAMVVEALHLMRREQVGCLLVCEGPEIVGIITERDLVRRVLALGKPLSMSVAQCMTPNPVVVQRKEPIGAAIKRMEEGGY